MPRFTIIIPVYNVAPYLRECLESTQTQTFADWECLCVDDGSTDDSGSILDEYAAKDPRFRVFHKENGGVASARNLALDHATGDWILFLDGDDCLAEGALEAVAEAVQSNPDSDALLIDRVEFREKRDTAGADADRKVTRHQDVTFALFNRFTMGVCAALLKAEVIDGQRFKPYRLSEDALFFAETFFNCRVIAELNFPVYCYRTRAGSAMNREPDCDTLREWFGAMREILACLQTHRTVFSPEEWRPVVGKYAESAYYTNRLWLFRLPCREMKHLLPVWSANLRAVEALGPIAPHKRLVIAVVRLFRSAFLAKCLILGGRRLALTLKGIR